MKLKKLLKKAALCTWVRVYINKNGPLLKSTSAGVLLEAKDTEDLLSRQVTGFRIAQGHEGVLEVFVEGKHDET